MQLWAHACIHKLLHCGAQTVLGQFISAIYLTLRVFIISVSMRMIRPSAIRPWVASSESIRWAGLSTPVINLWDVHVINRLGVPDPVRAPSLVCWLQNQFAKSVWESWRILELRGGRVGGGERWGGGERERERDGESVRGRKKGLRKK